MKTKRIFMPVLIAAALFAAALFSAAPACAQDPIKWSAPMTMYPRAWAPTPAPPPSYYNPYGHYNPYQYGYGQNHWGRQGYGNSYRNYGYGHYGNQGYYYGR